MKKYTRVEASEVLSPKQHDDIEEELRRLGKTSATELSSSERKNLRTLLDKQS